MSLTFADIARVTGGSLQSLDPARTTNAIPVIDSRQAKQGTFFIALPGERVDGNSFCAAAIQAGAEFVITTSTLDIPSVIVDDVLAAVTALAQYVREELTQLTVIGLTGSHGKTTTKDLLTQVLAPHGETVSPKGSFNNEIGVPLTLLHCNESTKFCIVEMGARHKGDIKHLCDIAHPQIGVVLVVGTAHVGEFGSREKLL